MDFTELLLIALSALFGSLLTFFSGFGLGTILLAVLSFFFSLETAIIATAIIHFLNNLFKWGITRRHIHLKTLIRFGISALPAALLGSLLLKYLVEQEAIFRYQIFDIPAEVTFLKITIGILMLLFSLLELSPGLFFLKTAHKHLIIGGLLSGFFGGISGHQGAFRSAFLIKAQLSKDEFIGTSAALALMIDLTRIITYLPLMRSNFLLEEMKTGLIIGIFFAIAGTFLGSKILKKITIHRIQQMVGILLIIYGFLFIAGIL